MFMTMAPLPVVKLLQAVGIANVVQQAALDEIHLQIHAAGGGQLKFRRGQARGCERAPENS